MMKQSLLLLLATIIFTTASNAQQGPQKFSHLDTLFGSNTPQRSWWDVQRYDVLVKPDYNKKTITGKTTITYTVNTDQPNDYIQIDLQTPLQIDQILYNGKAYID